MKDAPAIYLARIVSKNNFRTFIYSHDGSQKLVESWDSYEKHMETGLWFATKEEVKEPVVETEKPKRSRKTTVKAPELKNEPIAEGVLGELGIEPDKAHDGMAFEVSNDDFLPNKSRK